MVRVHKGRWAMPVSLGLVLGCIAPPADAWLLQARIDPLEETRLAQSRHLARAFETAFREAFERERGRAAVPSACRQAAERAVAATGAGPGWRLTLTDTSSGQAASAARGTGAAFRYQARLDGVPPPCLEGAASSHPILTITLEP